MLPLPALHFNTHAYNKCIHVVYNCNAKQPDTHIWCVSLWIDGALCSIIQLRESKQRNRMKMQREVWRSMEHSDQTCNEETPSNKRAHCFILFLLKQTGFPWANHSTIWLMCWNKSCIESIHRKEQKNGAQRKWCTKRKPKKSQRNKMKWRTEYSRWKEKDTIPIVRILRAMVHAADIDGYRVKELWQMHALPNRIEFKGKPTHWTKNINETLWW